MSEYDECYEPDYEADRKAACKWAHDLMQRKDWAIIDTETSGLRGVVLEIAIIAPDGSELFNSLIHPDGERIEEGARAVHKISDADLERAPKLAEIWPQVQAALEGRTTIVAYNAQFDHSRILQSARRYELPQLSQKWECAMERYAEYVGEWNNYYQSYKRQRLPGAGHRAIEDARAALEVIQKMATSWEREYMEKPLAAQTTGQADSNSDVKAGRLIAWLKEREAEA